MKGKHRKTLAAVFHDPVSGNIEWAAIEGLLIAAGARVIEGRGSRGYCQVKQFGGILAARRHR